MISRLYLLHWVYIFTYTTHTVSWKFLSDIPWTIYIDLGLIDKNRKITTGTSRFFVGHESKKKS